ncbi:Putative CDP-alcohol phosphatidyltransferase class-I family protein C22A12.08c [Glycine soja]|nr:Putative CDP-alcohol phosphatidyltransferase class-I family protein C22A12.08c [Glycine soja]
MSFQLLTKATKRTATKRTAFSYPFSLGFSHRSERYALSIDEYASCFENIDPLAPYKKWTTKLAATLNAKFNESVPRNDVFSKRVQAAFVVSDPVDWSRDIQLYMIGDNPAVDIRGARQTGHPWFSILTRTVVFKGKENHDKFSADLVVDTVEEAVDYILANECAS